MTIVFDTLNLWVGGYFTTNTALTFTAYDESDNIVGTDNSLNQPNFVGSGSGIPPNYYLSVTYSGGIKKIVIEDSGNCYTLDDLTWKDMPLDQQQTKDFRFAGCYDNHWLGQSFKPTLSTLTCVKLYMMKSGAPPDDVVLSVRSNLYGPDLTSISILSGDIPTDWEWVVFDLPDISVTPGNTYYLVLRTTGGTIMNGYIWSYGLVTPYTSGELWKSYTGGSWGSWQMCRWYDFCFKTYG